MDVISRITNGPTEFAFGSKVLGKYEISYFRCIETGFIQTEDPYWLDEAYSSAITALDLGIIDRNLEKSQLTSRIVEQSIKKPSTYLDYGGGYGIFTRLMRDKGYDYRHYDLHCENLFAKGFSVESLADCYKFSPSLTTAWEVMEHIVNPIKTINEILAVSDKFLFSTELVPSKGVRQAGDWWYTTPETGQHVSFYTLKSLEFLAEKFNVHLYTDGRCNHLMSKSPLAIDPFKKRPATFVEKVGRKLGRFFGTYDRNAMPKASLLTQDYQLVLADLRCKQMQIKTSPQHG